MADWFKFYENGMDEPRFRYALRTLSGVCPVWILILSECCRHKSDTFRWTGDEVDLIGWSEKACLNPPVVNEAMKLLAKIRYIEITETTIRVLNWNKLQSDYCRKSLKKTPESVRTGSGECPDRVRLEESRGEEIRGESALSSFAEIPSWGEFWEYCQKSGLAAEWFARDKFNAAETDNWNRKSNWRAYANRCRTWWESDGRPMQPPKRKVNGHEVQQESAIVREAKAELARLERKR